jgi:hypothetical protein
MAQRPFVCSECDSRVSAASFRASCPECGGKLTNEPLGSVRADESDYAKLS